MHSRKWVKLYCENWIEGTLREESPELRGIWADILALAGDGHYGDSGIIQLSNGIAYTDGQIAGVLRISEELWGASKKRLIDTNRIEITSNGAISIVNWSKYQSEYDRQKGYRMVKSKESKLRVLNHSTPSLSEGDKEREIQGKGEREGDCN